MLCCSKLRQNHNLLGENCRGEGAYKCLNVIAKVKGRYKGTDSDLSQTTGTAISRWSEKTQKEKPYRKGLQVENLALLIP